MVVFFYSLEVSVVKKQKTKKLDSYKITYIQKILGPVLYLNPHRYLADILEGWINGSGQKFQDIFCNISQIPTIWL